MNTPLGPASGPDGKPELDVTSPDALLRVTLRLTGGGMYVERSHEAALSGRIVQGLLFTNEPEFLLWCDSDDARFDYPLMCSKVRRAGCALLQRTPRLPEAEGNARVD